jgi:hypothetical protein
LGNRDRIRVPCPAAITIATQPDEPFMVVS